ncbi:MAG: DUF692 family protein [Nitrospira sp.]|nr:DUF692 family protein [Nitrospira sp.]
MAVVDPVAAEFARRLEQVPVHGLGLSVDVYSPDLRSLLGALRKRQVLPSYLEIFRAASTALDVVRRQVGDCLLTYHGEGLWLSQPETVGDPVFAREIQEVAGHLRTLESAWLNHECATKYVAGHAYGTYLPPLYTESSAAVVAENTLIMQALLDGHCRLATGATPLVLLEMPPLTYFVAGTLAIPEFFRLVTRMAPCGLVLDIGHLWTVYRYSGAWRTGSLMQFVDDFLDEFPMDRVVEIHVAGLAIHESSLADPSALVGAKASEGIPAWTDAHAAAIPPVLFEILDRVLGHPRLTALRGLALEVDTKPIPLIVDEFSGFAERYAWVISQMKHVGTVLQEGGVLPLPRPPIPIALRQALEADYDRYARVVTGQVEPEGSEWCHPTACTDDLDIYRSVYLPYEILTWGGEIHTMFPDTCGRLVAKGVSLLRFVSFWFCRPQPVSGPYDFFLVKISRFLDFVREVAPELIGVSEREAEALRQDYDLANELPLQAAGE